MKTVFIVTISFLLALVLAILPLPKWMNILWPDWVVLVLIYWVMALPHRVSVGSAWIVGIFMDVLFGTTLGVHALALVCVAYITAKFHIRIRNFGLLQQSGFVFMVLIIYHAILLWSAATFGNVSGIFVNWVPAIISAFVWPWILLLLHDFLIIAK